MKIILKLEREGFVLKFKWGVQEVTGNYAVKTIFDDLSNPYVDFAPNKDGVDYYLQLRGGATVSSIKRITKRLIESKPNLAKGDWKVIKNLNKWANKSVCENKAFYIEGNSKIFETAHFQFMRKDKRKTKKLRRKREYLPSPFGSFEHFRKVAAKQGLRKYINYLKNDKYYLRVTDRISASEINWLR